MAFEVTATRKRPQQFDSLAGQEFVVSTLKNAIDQGRIAHAYLFSGPRGVGKTTCARLLAKALNCEKGPTSNPCSECENCRGIAKGNNLDVIEIDGASNTGVNDVRVIKEEVLFPPTSSRYKIYIIDEVHMLSQSAFNALLKTIEEPPDYVVFIFATTETQKVPATIRSRCQQFNFQLLNIETIKGLLKQAADEMNIIADDDALFWIAKEATGSMRDAYTLFDQVVSFSDGKISLAKIREKLGLIGTDRINQIMTSVLASNNGDAINKIQDLLQKGVSIDQTVKDFTEYFRSILLIRQGVTSENILGCQSSAFPYEILNAYTVSQIENALDMFLDLYRNIRYSLNPRFELELAIAKLGRLKYKADNATVLEQLARLKNDLITGTITPLNPAMKEIPTVKPAPVEKDITSEPDHDHVENSQEMPLLYSEEKLKQALPQGVGNFENTEHGIMLQFGSNFYYQAALRDIEKIRTSVSEAVGKDVNVIISFSEKLANERNRQFQEELKSEQKKEQEVSNVKELDSEGKHIFEDVMSIFRGHEEK